MKCGHYEIISAIGAGGMGEVYRGRDTKLHRDVAMQNGGAQARWSADGKHLYYMGLDGRLHLVGIDVTADRAIAVGTDTPLFTPRTAGGPVPGSDKQTYAVAKDGRLLIVVRPEGDQPSPLSVIVNWRMTR